MRILPSGFQEHLDSNETTLCWCWLITRTDGTKLGFTNHDVDITFDSNTYDASTGMLASEAESSLGLSVDNMDVEGAIESDKITESDLSAGVYDDATIEVYVVNWEDTTERVLIKKGNLGEITRGKTFFKVEVRGLSARLQQKQGRTYNYGCDADLGDTRCGIDLTSSTYKGTGTVVTTNGSSTLTHSGLSSYSNNWFDRGKLTFTSGNNNGRSFEVKFHDSNNIVLWSPAPFTITISDTFTITAGCDKLFSTCKSKFNNKNNFRGFPHMPSTDLIISYANTGDEDLDGGSLFNE